MDPYYYGEGQPHPPDGVYDINVDPLKDVMDEGDMIRGAVVRGGRIWLPMKEGCRVVLNPANFIGLVIFYRIDIVAEAERLL